MGIPFIALKCGGTRSLAAIMFHGHHAKMSGRGQGPEKAQATALP
jgi:hypothetical protein